MNQTTSNQRLRAGRMKNFFTEKNSFIVPNADIIADITEFNNLLPMFDDFAERQQQPITGYAEAKKEALDGAAEIVSKWGVRCHLKADDSGNPTLAELLNHSFPEITGMEDVEGLNLLKDMRNGLNDNLSLFVDQGLTAAVIVEINNRISLYDGLINKPKEAISERKMETAALESLMKSINEKLKSIVSLLEALWTPAHSELIIEMKNNYRIDDLGHRFTAIQGVVSLPVPGNVANYKVVGVKDGTEYIKETVTNLLGEYKIQSLKPGLYEFKVVAPNGSVVKTEIITIERGVTLDYNWTV